MLELRSHDTRLFRPYFRRLRRSLAQVIQEGQRSGEIARAIDPEIAASIWIGAVDGLLLQYVVDREPFAECWRFILRGDDWVGTAIELTDPTLDAIRDLKRSDTAESPCVTLR